MPGSWRNWTCERGRMRRSDLPRRFPAARSGVGWRQPNIRPTSKVSTAHPPPRPPTCWLDSKADVKDWQACANVALRKAFGLWPRRSPPRRRGSHPLGATVPRPVTARSRRHTHAPPHLPPRPPCRDRRGGRRPCISRGSHRLHRQRRAFFRRQGNAEAITDPRVLTSFASAVIGAPSRPMSIGRRRMRRRSSSAGPSSTIRTAPRGFAATLMLPQRCAKGSYATGAAFLAGRGMIEGSDIDSLRKVIGFSGDSANNLEGPPVAPIRAKMPAARLTIHAFAVLCRDCSGLASDDLVGRCEGQVPRGPRHLRQRGRTSGRVHRGHNAQARPRNRQPGLRPDMADGPRPDAARVASIMGTLRRLCKQVPHKITTGKPCENHGAFLCNPCTKPKVSPHSWIERRYSASPTSRTGVGVAIPSPPSYPTSRPPSKGAKAGMGEPSGWPV